MAKTWADIYFKWLGKGMDHGYAAYMACKWEDRKKRQARKEAIEILQGEVKDRTSQE